LKQCLSELIDEDVRVEMLGAWLGALAVEKSARIVYSPFMRARVDRNWHFEFRKTELMNFMSRFWGQIWKQLYYSQNLGLDRTRGYAEVSRQSRRDHISQLQKELPTYSEWLVQHLRIRALRYERPEVCSSVSMITTVYEKTDVNLLDALAASLEAQKVKAFQWIIIAHGPIAEDMLGYLRLACLERWGATLIIEEQPLGIMGAMRRGLDAATSDYIVPVDADDVLTADAFQIISHFISKLEKPDLLFSDEDLLIDDTPSTPYLRAEYDPILNLDSSYVWHLCAIKRTTAIALGIYTDLGATWCHDWDTIMRFANANARIAHIPEVLYHWRQHQGSTTNNSHGDDRSLQSVRHVLQSQIGRTADPEKFYVAEWPIHRGAKELYIARRNQPLPNVRLLSRRELSFGVDPSDSTVFMYGANGVLIDSQDVFVEVVRIFDLHADVGAVGGLLVGTDGIVLDACYLLNVQDRLESPWIGRSLNYGGSYGLAQKTQSVSTTGKLLAFFRGRALHQIGAGPEMLNEMGSHAAIELCVQLSKSGWRVAFSPLVNGRLGSTHKASEREMHAPADLRRRGSALMRYEHLKAFRD
jgi:O-antigen biosynthesis protein